MPTFKALFGAAAAAAMLTATTGAAAAAPVANPAARLSLSAPRAGATTGNANRLGASVPTTTLISIGVLAALVVIVLVATKGDNNGGSPASP